MKTDQEGALKAHVGEKGTLTVGNKTYGIGVVETKKLEIGFTMFSNLNNEREAGEMRKKRLRGRHEALAVFIEIITQMNKDLGYAKCTQAQLALELSIDKANVSRAIKFLTTRPADATDDPLTQELVRRVPDGFIVNPMFAIVGLHVMSWEIWFRNAPPETPFMGVSEQEIAASQRIEGRKAMGEKKAKYLRDKGEVRARKPRLELVA